MYRLSTQQMSGEFHGHTYCQITFNLIGGSAIFRGVDG
jgi:hypothetical protein